ncbi:hypothetical protein WG29040_05455 [Pseudomonas sp. PAMC 29040]|uniref:hypothetical protein n=1 Tax=Pseudomonas sp. PAMC 29040 TaxID=2498450 RepID=UPI000F9C9631|nr:hypothetical protein [Pseudomonas sp. PAMC 29040]RUT39766.1 hypothetical protein WG29040_05455 [Pseudomonas sp. PAMC 29040]
MEDAVIVTTQMLPKQARALHASIRAQYLISLNEHWYADEYRYVPQGARHESILKKFPAMAAQVSLLAALTASLKALNQL